MIIIPERDKELVEEKFKQFQDKYIKLYTKEMPELVKPITEQFMNYVFNPDCPDVLMQIKGELDLESIEGDFYEEHLNIIQKNFDITGNILDIASGFIPTFANKLAKRQLKLGKGTVTIYDPRLLQTKRKYKNIIPNKSPWDKSKSIKNINLITGILPCEVTDEIIEVATKNNIDFYLALCGCVHSNSSNPIMPLTPEEEHTRIIRKAKYLLEKYTDKILLEDKLDDKYSLNYPIIYTKKK